MSSTDSEESLDRMTNTQNRTVMLAYGTRPEAIKMAPLVTALADSEHLTPVVAVTGQHREMLDQVNELFGIEPDHDLDLMVPGATLTELACRALAGMGRVIDEVRPDAVVVQGDTTTAFCAGLAAFYAGVPVIHLEAGLRSGDITSPFPEEGNRKLLAPVTALHLAPTATSRGNLLAEGVEPATVVTTGNTVIDALFEATGKPASFTDDEVREVVESGEPFVLVTAHRRESWGAPMTSAMAAVAAIAKDRPGLRFLVPMHRNPVVREVITSALGDLPNVTLTEPLGYHEFCHAMRACTVVLTDSGGVQEEAPSLGKPVLVMRDNTERPEAVHAGTVELVGTDTAVIESRLLKLLDDPDFYASMANAVNPYGDGVAAARATAAIAELLGVGTRLPDFAL